MEVIRRLGVVGVGLIGASFALALRRSGRVREIVGMGRTQANLDVAIARGAIDRGGSSPEVLAGCDVVLLATPLAQLEPMALAVAPHLGDGTIVTDAGSAKTSIVSHLTNRLPATLRFVGSHPIAGTEGSGAGAADPDLFRGARCVLTPTPATDGYALARVRELWEAVGMVVVEMSPEAHDRVLALTSHAPHLLAFALALAAERSEAEGETVLPFAGPSFRSATRVAASSPEMWRDILLANGAATLEALARIEAALDHLRSAIQAGDGEALAAAIRAAGTVCRRLDATASAPASGSGERPHATTPLPQATAAAGALRVFPAAGGLHGEVRIPGDKSIAHRALILGALADGTTRVRGVGGGEDNASTMRVLAALGVEIERTGNEVTIEGRGFAGLRPPRDTLDCGNSGTTMRLLAGVLAGQPFQTRLDGDASLRRRPMQRVITPLAAMGAQISSSDGRPPLTVVGMRLRPARIVLDVASAQLKTAVLLAGLQAEGVTSVVEPSLSRDHTERILPAFGVRVERVSPLEVAVRGPARLRPTEIDVPGDPSAAAFWIVAGAIVRGSQVTMRGVGVNPTRTGAIDVLRAMGARLQIVPGPDVGDEPTADLVVEAGPLEAAVVSGETMLRAIDEFPILAVAAACATGETRFEDAGELRVKESDRIAAMAAGLASLGADVEERPDGMVIRGPASLSGGTVESHGDHRVAMAFAVAALVAAGPIEIREAEAMAVSYPDFHATLERLAGRAS